MEVVGYLSSGALFSALNMVRLFLTSSFFFLRETANCYCLLFMAAFSSSTIRVKYQAASILSSLVMRMCSCCSCTGSEQESQNRKSQKPGQSSNKHLHLTFFSKQMRHLSIDNVQSLSLTKPSREEVFSAGVDSRALAVGSGSMLNLYVLPSLLATCIDRGGIVSVPAIPSLLYIVLEVYNRSGVFKI